MTLQLQPIEFSWGNEWLPRVRRSHQLAAVLLKQNDPKGAARALGTWQNEVDAWLTSLSEKKKRDVVELLTAEADLLFISIDLTDASTNSDEASDFRERYYDAIPLLNAAVRLDLPHIASASRTFDSLATYAQKRGWLP